ncbi:MAG: YceI family protein [Pseudomonadota bacterium]
MINVTKTTLIGVTAAMITLAGSALAHDHKAGTKDHHAEEAAAPAGQFAATGDIAEAQAGTYAIEPTHAYISMSYNHLGFSYPVLGFTKFDGTLTIDPNDLSATALTVNIDPASIDSRVEVFDGHLKGDKFFNVAEHKEISFVATAMMPESGGHGKVAGDLTIKGITKPVVLDIVLHKAGANPINQKQIIGVSGKTTVMRSDFDLGLYAPNVSDAVDVTISAEFVKTDS